MKTHALRLLPNSDLKKDILIFCQLHKISAGIILCSVGSLKNANLRFADQKNQTQLAGPFEILSLNGTIAKNGVHLHMSISDHQGSVYGGHMLDGCLIHTTCELVIGELADTQFMREIDPQTNYMELKIK
jgi:predicted DNA-binding protein with PD1-like motif